MNRMYVLLLVLLVCFSTGAQSQTTKTAPQPNPELKKLQVLVGHWTVEGEYKPGPMGAGGKMTGDYTLQFILKGFFLEEHGFETGAMGTGRYIEIEGYDPVSKSLTTDSFGDDGGRFAGTITVSGNTITWEGKLAEAGKEYWVRNPITMSADSMSAVSKADISTDGKTWVPFFEGKFTKTKPAPKK